MQDAIINGSGNSRFLKSINELLTLYPDYESFALALIEGTLPIDLNGINPAGWAQQGTPLNKANLLSDTTETAIWGNMGNRTVDAALNKLASLIGEAQSIANSKAKISTGTYTGNSSVSSPVNQSITVGFRPFLVIVHDYTNKRYYIAMYQSSSDVVLAADDSSNYVRGYDVINIPTGSSATTFAALGTSTNNVGANLSGCRYYYIALG